MTLQEHLDNLATQYELVCVFNLDQWFDQPTEQREKWLADSLKSIWRNEYQNNQRLVFTLTCGDEYHNDSMDLGSALQNLQFWANRVDISNYFIVVLTNEPNTDSIQQRLKEISRDPVGITLLEVTPQLQQRRIVAETKHTRYQYNSPDLVNMSMDKLTDRERFLLTESRTFCIYPWIHIHAYPTGEAYPCCHAEMGVGRIGNCREQPLKEIWNNPRQRQLRLDMLSETPNAACTRCYEQEKSGFFSGRQSANKHHGHHIREIYTTDSTGANDSMVLTYWDIRFSNLCNLRCRSCGHIFSSQWYQDQVRLAGPEWGKKNRVLNYAGRTETDMWEQLEPHLDYVEQIYFAGGEPLLMEEHYKILDELLRRGRTDVRLIYNTNFTNTDLKGRSVFEYWQQFRSVAVGASLDAQGPRAEYIRKGTDWQQVEKNRREMISVCPNVDFYISATLSILNAKHITDFHRDWVELGLIKAQDFNINILQDPAYYRIDIATPEYKKELSTRYLNHIMWLRDRDPLGRATQGFESAITFMNSTDNSGLIPRFWEKTTQLDLIRNESCLNIIPELGVLRG